MVVGDGWRRLRGRVGLWRSFVSSSAVPAPGRGPSQEGLEGRARRPALTSNHRASHRTLSQSEGRVVSGEVGEAQGWPPNPQGNLRGSLERMGLSDAGDPKDLEGSSFEVFRESAASRPWTSRSVRGVPGVSETSVEVPSGWWG